MSEELEQLKRQIRADFELTRASQADANRRLEAISERIDEQAGKIAEQGSQIAEQGRRIAEQGRRIEQNSHLISASMKETARLGREVAENGRQLVGRLRLMDERYGKMFELLEKEINQKAPLSRVQQLEDRVRLLEERGPAA